MKNIRFIAFLFCVALLGAAACRADAILDSHSSNVSPITVQSNSCVNFIDSPDAHNGCGPTHTDYNATVVSETINGLSSSLTFENQGNADYGYAGTGDRLVLLITNGTGHSLSGIDFDITGSAYFTSGIYPNVGSFTPKTKYADAIYSITQGYGSGVNITHAASELDITFQNALAVNATTAIFIPVDISKCHNTFTLAQTAATVPEPATMALGGLGLCLLGLVRRKLAKS